MTTGCEPVFAARGENLVALVQEAHRILEAGDADQLIAYLAGVDVEDVRRVSGAANSHSEPAP